MTRVQPPLVSQHTVHATLAPLIIWLVRWCKRLERLCCTGSALSSSRQSTRASSPPSGNRLTNSLSVPIIHTMLCSFPSFNFVGLGQVSHPLSLPTGLHLSSLPSPSQIVTTLVILGGARGLGLVHFPSPSKDQFIKVLSVCVYVCV